MKTENIRSSIESWDQVDWKIVNRTIVKLRRRIFDSKRLGNLKSLCNLQRLMLNSSANILFSIRKVSYNKGCRTPGVDGVTIDRPSDRLRLFNLISETGWDGLDPKPIRRIYIQETDKLRPIGIPTVYDRVIQTMILNSLEPEWEAVFEIGSYGFRPKRNVNDAISRLWLSLNKPGSRKWIVDSDISKCFDTISHKYLLSQLSGFPGVDLIEKMLVSGVIIRDIWLSSEDEGTPQGSALSPLLCNIALHGLESELKVSYTKKGYIDPKGRSLIRFADDLVILCHSKADALLALGELSLALSKRGLKISEQKTSVVHITQGFDFLGFNIRLWPKKYASFSKAIIKLDEENYIINHKLTSVYVSPSDKSIRKVKKKLKTVFLTTKGSPARTLVHKLNPIIRGYVLSKRHWHSNKAFRHIDEYIYTLCWRWARRKHPQKNLGWIRKKYFKHLTIGPINNKWVFAAEREDTSNPLLGNDVYVLKSYWIGISDYLVAKMDKRPDNRFDADYFKDLEDRRNRSRKFNIFRKLDNQLVISQDFMCPICEQELFNEEKLHLHHIIPTSRGGKSTFSNLLYLHLPCHYQAHSSNNFEYFLDFLKKFKASHPAPKPKK